LEEKIAGEYRFFYRRSHASCRELDRGSGNHAGIHTPAVGSVFGDLVPVRDRFFTRMPTKINSAAVKSRGKIDGSIKRFVSRDAES
jgi:hypothetical protein